MLKPTTPIENVDATPVPNSYVLYVVTRGETHPTGHLRRGQKLTIGSAPDCDLVVAMETVSRQHVLLEANDEGLTVKDCGSTNGTWYLDQRIETIVVTHGARLRLGSCELDILPEYAAEHRPISARDQYGDLHGTSLAMRRLFASLEQIEATEAPVCIQGETGTGKELIARAIHAHSRRKDRPFVVVDCGAIAAQLLQSELFGHRKGAFTGASSDRKGAFEVADGGTVFLDEIDSLPENIQPALLRVVESGEIKRLGDTTHVNVDVRVISASQQSLRDVAAEGRFREDLYFRLAVLPIVVPRLRERREDIPMLTDVLARQLGYDPEQLPIAAREFFLRYDWPGNVRELRNAVQRTLAIGHEEMTSSAPSSASAAPVSSEQPFHQAKSAAVDRFERAYLSDLVERFDGNLSASARHAGVDRKHLRTLLKKHGIR